MLFLSYFNNFVLSVIFGFILFIYPFFSSLENKKRTILSSFAFIILTGSFIAVISVILHFDFFLFNTFGVICIMPLILFYLHRFPVDFRKTLFQIAFVLYSSCCYISINSYFQTLFTTKAAFDSSKYNSSLEIISLVPFCTVFPLTLLIIKKCLVPIYELPLPSKAWDFLWAIPLGHFILQLSFCETFYYETIHSFFYIFKTVFLLLLTVLTYRLIYRLLIQSSQMLKLDQKLQTSSQQLKFQKKQYESLRQNIADTKKARHDLRHHLILIKKYCEEESYDLLKQYLDEYLNSVPEMSQTVYCENHAVQNLLEYFHGLFIQDSVCFQYELALKNDCKIADIDLCVLLSNALENALEACRSLPAKRRYIKLSITPVQNKISIIVENPFLSEVKIKNGQHLSQKRGYTETGVGLASIKSVVQKYHGQLKIVTDEQTFRLKIFLTAAPSVPPDTAFYMP